MPRTQPTIGQHAIRQAREAVTREWGARAFAQLGPRFQRALLAEAVLNIASQQDAMRVGDATVRAIATEGYTAVVAATPDAYTA